MIKVPRAFSSARGAYQNFQGGLMRFFMAALAAAFVLAVVAAPAQAVGDPVTCAGYPEPRVNIGHQAGWTDSETAAYADAEHVHAEFCFPEHQTVSGNLTIDVVVKMHNAPQPLNRVKRVRIQPRSNSNDYSYEVTDPKDLNGNYLTCPVADCAWTVPVTVPTDSMVAGKFEFRVQVETTRDPASLNNRTLSTGADIVCVRSCSGVTPEVSYKEARGWYKQSTGVILGYINARWGFSSADDALFPWQNGVFAAKTGTWCPPIKTLLGSNEGAAVTIDESFASVDPNFHGGSPGVQTFTKAGTLANGDYCIDTTTLTHDDPLTSSVNEGMHKLFWRVHADKLATGSEFTGQLWGAYVVPFNVG